MVLVEVTLLVFGIIIFLGFFASVFFERTKIPDVLLLMLLGVFLGPVLGLVNSADVFPLASTVGTLALIVILFDSGLKLNAVQLIREIPKATIFSVVAFIFGSIFVAGLMHFALGWELLHALLLGVVAGGTGSNVVLPIVQRLSVSQDAKAILSLESLITDVLALVSAFVVLQILESNSFSAAQAAGSIASAFSIALVAGLLSGLFWLGILKRFYGKPLGWVTTLGFMFVLYAGINFLGGNGAIAVLTFSLVLGHGQQIASLLKWQGEFKLDAAIRSTQDEVSFFVRTFYFVYLGLLFSFSFFTLPLLLACAIALAGFLAARFFALNVLGKIDAQSNRYSLVFMTMMPRGLISAVLAFLPAERGIIIPGFEGTVFLILLFTNLIATAGAFAYEMQPRSSPKIVATRETTPKGETKKKYQE